MTTINKLFNKHLVSFNYLRYFFIKKIFFCQYVKYIFISLRSRKCGFTHASRAEIRVFTPHDIKFRTILVRKNVFLTSVITSLAFGSCCKLTLVRKRFIALVA